MNSNTITQILKELDFRVAGTLWIESKEGRFLGPGRVELLERISNTGSINKAAKEMGMSYKKAWEMVSSLNAQAQKPLVLTQTGGEKGGGAVVTEEAQQLIEYHRLMRERFRAFLEKESAMLTQP
ncbi:winged helix-turn-helix domain-containing protein [Runella zeae]|uniref:winged helix-turn-helix domain-containing protein n=1 Tax=Runella zeae TaxID=94255 RepID=UPI0004240D02|nr:LysR family transcriptional regulator [Runella zeae]